MPLALFDDESVMTDTFPESAGSTPTEDRLFTLRNASDMCVTISERSASMVAWLAPDRYGRTADVLLGHAEGNGARQVNGHLGSVIGGTGGETDKWYVGYAMPIREPANDRGDRRRGEGMDLHAARWRGEATAEGVSLRRSMSAGENGFTDDADVQLRYYLGDDGSLAIDYEAVSDAAIPRRLTAFPHFNLNGGVADVGDHMLQIDADRYLEIDANGNSLEVSPVSGTPFDFRRAAAIGPRLRWPNAQIRVADGFEHCFLIRDRGDDRPAPLREAARVYDPGSGRCLYVSTTAAALRFYSGNRLDGVRGRGARPYARHDGFCLEASAYPAHRGAELASAAVHRRGEIFRQTTVYRMALK